MHNLICRAKLGMPSRLLLIFIGLMYSQLTFADENGISFWLSGQYAAMAAVPSNPGWSLTLTPYSYSGKSNNFQQGQNIKVKVSFAMLQLGYSAEERILGGQAYVGMGWGAGNTNISVSATNPNGESNLSNAVTGIMDINPLATLAWSKGNNNFMTYVTGGIPVGTYSATSYANVGLGHAAMDVGGGYTYLNNTTGLEFSSILGATYNWMNKQTSYQSGIDSHLDWSLSQSLSQNWQAGIAGYAYRQLTGDSGSGNKVGAFKSQVAAIGPQMMYLFNIGKKPAYISVSAYKEFWAKNRAQGYAMIGAISIPIGN